MANSVHKKRGAKIGLKVLLFAELLTDTAEGTSYKPEVHEMHGAIEAGITVQISDEALSADDNPVFDQFEALDSVDVNLTLAAMSPDVEAFLLGRKEGRKRRDDRQLGRQRALCGNGIQGPEHGRQL